jgi:alkylglycerol monooxygenase
MLLACTTVGLLHLEAAVATAVRYAIMTNGGFAWLLMWPLTCFETAFIQFAADNYEGRAFMPTLTRRWLRNSMQIAVVEVIGLIIVLHGRVPVLFAQKLIVMPSVTLLPPWLKIWAHSVWRVPLFELGLDLSFYIFHRTCHTSPFLYNLIHRVHHTDTAKAHGRLVAYETYTLTLFETLSFLHGYLVGLVVLYVTTGPIHLAELALLVTYAHTVECTGHTALSWSPPTMWRTLPIALGVELYGTDHTRHHKHPNSNYSKRFSLWDRLGGTYVKAVA